MRLWLILSSVITICIHAKEVVIVGGGIIGALESYYAYQDACKTGEKVNIIIYEKGTPFGESNTSYNIVPSLTIDEILSVVPRGAELMEKLAIRFSEPGGIRIDDVPGINDSPSALKFKESAMIYGSDPTHNDRTLSLLQLGTLSMNLWQQLYNEGDEELKSIFESSNFHPCHEPHDLSNRVLHDGYRIDLIYDVPDAKQRAMNMQASYENMGYQHCALLSPEEVVSLDPFLADFCQSHSDGSGHWHEDTIALWRPGGCLDTNVFLPKFFAYLEKLIGADAFHIHFNSKVVSVALESSTITALHLENGQECRFDPLNTEYIFCPGESIGTMDQLGFHEPAYAAFAGPAIFINIPLTPEQAEQYGNFSHCMEVHKEGVVLAWQARCKKDSIFIGVGGTKAFYGNQSPDKQGEFAKNRHLLQLNMVNQVLPEFISLATGEETQGKTLGLETLLALEEKGILLRWVGRRAVAYDGFPTLGRLYHNDNPVFNARLTTHLGSGGVSFGPAAVCMSRSAFQDHKEEFAKKILTYADSRRVAE